MADVIYSNDCEIYHMNTRTGSYDAKIDVHPGSTQLYTTRDNWVTHSHYGDENGEYVKYHGDLPNDWEDRCRS